ncbi:MAG TPA: ATP-binding protein, partial [Bacteroidales bacterium]
EIEKIPFQPVNELMKLRELLKYKAEEKGIDLLCDLHPDIPKVLIGDPVRLNQVLLNLTGNAIKFTEKGKIRVSIYLKEIIETKAIIECAVMDTGIGIPKDRLDKIFDSFTQADSDTTRKYGGTGLGLTISKQLIELQNGSISVKSIQGEGSIFTFRIPFEIGEEVEIPLHKEPVAKKKLKKLKILLVEDNEFNIMVVSEELTGFAENVKIELAKNGKEAVNKVISTDYDLVLMDIEMLEMNGYEAARAIREMAPPKSKVPIIAMTANAMKGEIQKCFDAGMNEFISKPFDPEDLKSKVHNLVGKELA